MGMLLLLIVDKGGEDALNQTSRVAVYLPLLSIPVQNIDNQTSHASPLASRRTF
jgi:hypothetical protein